MTIFEVISGEVHVNGEPSGVLVSINRNGQSCDVQWNGRDPWAGARGWYDLAWTLGIAARMLTFVHARAGRFTRDDLEMTLAFADPHGTGEFLPEAAYRSCADLDGMAAHMFLQGLGYAVSGHADFGTNGAAWTACGIVLSTNGYVVRDHARRDHHHARLGGMIAKRTAKAAS